MNRYTRTYLLITVSIITLLSTSCSNSKKADTSAEPQAMTIFAAASLSDVMTEIIDSFQVHNDAKISINLASSGTLARQIEQGETPDVFISASKNWIEYVDSLGKVVQPFKKTIVTNKLVLIAPVDNPIDSVEINSLLDFMSLLGSDRLSIGDPQHVPAGKYAKQSLDYYGWYTKVEKKILPAKDVRSALMVVEMGEAPAGIVYSTDVLKSTKVKIIGVFPEESHKPIVYVGAVCRDSEIAKAFFNYINSDDVKPIWEKYDFIR